MDRETYVEILDRLAAIENNIESAQNRIDMVRDVLSETIAKDITLANRVAALEATIAALTERIATLAVEPVSPHEDTLVATDQLMRGDVVRWSSGTSNQWRIFDHAILDNDGCWYAYMKGGISRLIPSPSIRLWYRQS